MPPAPQSLDPSSFPDQANPTKTGGLDPSAFPDQPKKPQTEPLSKTGTLGKSTKPSRIGPTGGTVYESIPLVTGQGGAIAGGAATAALAPESGPVGVETGAVAGAGAGGILGRYIQSLLQNTVGRTKFGNDTLGVPAPKTGKSTLAEAGKEGTAQMELEMGGRAVAAPLGWVRRGGFLNTSRQAMETLRESSGIPADNPSDWVPVTRVIKRGDPLTGHPSPAFGGNTWFAKGHLDSAEAAKLKDLYRGEQGQIVKGYVRRDLIDPSRFVIDENGHTVAPVSSHEITSGGFKNRLSEGRPSMRLSGPEIATGTPLGEISKTIQSYAGGAFGASQIQRKVREQGSKAAVKVIDDALAVLGHPGIGGGPTATSKGSAAAARSFVGELLDKAADTAPPIDVKAVKDLAAQELQKGIVQHLKAVPDVADPKLANTIRQLRNDPTLIQRLPRPELTRVADAILDKYKSPSLRILRRIMGMEDSTAARGVWEELKSLRGASTPGDELYAKSDAQRVATFFKGQLREALGTAAPDFGKAMGQYRDLVRGDWLRSNIVLGGKPVPTTEADMNDVLTGMADRLRKATESGRLARDFNDPDGQEVLGNLSRVAGLMEKRSAPMAGNLRKIFEIGRIITAGAGMATGHVSMGTAGAATLWEGFPDFFTWVIHDPKATRWFIEGVKAENPNTSTAAIIRLGELYRRTHQKTGAGSPEAQ